MLWKLPGWNPYTPCLPHFFILHSSYSSEQENNLVLLDFLVPNGYLFLFWVFSKFQNKFLNFPGVSYFLFFVNHQALGGVFHSQMSPRWLAGVGQLQAWVFSGYSLGQETPIHTKQLRIWCFTAVGLNSLLFTFCSVLPGEKSWSLIKRQKYEEMNSLLFFSSEVLSISCSFFYKSKMKVYKKKTNTTIKNSIPVLTEMITMSLAKMGIVLNITSIPVFCVCLILSPSFSVALFLSSFLSLFCC